MRLMRHNFEFQNADRNGSILKGIRQVFDGRDGKRMFCSLLNIQISSMRKVRCAAEDYKIVVMRFKNLPEISASHSREFTTRVCLFSPNLDDYRRCTPYHYFQQKKREWLVGDKSAELKKSRVQWKQCGGWLFFPLAGSSVSSEHALTREEGF